MIVVWLFLAVQWVCLQFDIGILSDNTHLLFSTFIAISVARTDPDE